MRVQEYTARLLRVCLADSLTIFVVLIQKQYLQHHFHGCRQIEVEVKLFKYLELGLNKHLRYKFYISLLVA